MRISTGMMYEMGLARLTENQGALNKTQQQVATGRRMLTPADDPAASASALRISQADAANTQHAANRGMAKSLLGMEDGVLGSVSDLLQNVKAAIVGAGNGAFGNAERRFIASELRGQLGQLIGLANSTDGNGNYLFAGFQSRALPFVQQGLTAGYAGDSGVRALQVSAERQIPAGDSGQAVFMSIPRGNGHFLASANPANAGSGVIGAGSVTNPALLTGQQYEIGFSIAGGVTTYSVTNVTTGVVLSSGNAYAPGSAIQVDGMQAEISGNPASGDRFRLAPSGSESVFDVLGGLIAALETPADTASARAVLTNALTVAHSGINNALERVLETRASVGARMNELNVLEDGGSYLHLQYQTRLSELQDLDYNTALSRLAMQQLSLEAAQKSFVQVSGLSLFKYL